MSPVTFEEYMRGMPNINEEEAVQSVGKGWEPLIRRLYAAMPADTQVVQVKEKFGGLRFYYYGGNEEFRALVDGAERESYTLCERCGKPGTTDDSQYWVLTLCDEHKAERKAARANR